MQVTDIHLIKAAIRDQAFIGRTLVQCPMGQVVAIRRRQGQLLAMVRGWGVHWYPVKSVTIETGHPCWRRREWTKMTLDRDTWILGQREERYLGRV